MNFMLFKYREACSWESVFIDYLNHGDYRESFRSSDFDALDSKKQL